MSPKSLPLSGCFDMSFCTTLLIKAHRTEMLTAFVLNEGFLTEMVSDSCVIQSWIQREYHHLAVLTCPLALPCLLRYIGPKCQLHLC